MQHLTLGYLTLDASPIETIQAAAAAGFRSVGIRISGRRRSDPYVRVIANPAMIGEIRKRIDDSGLRLSNIDAYHLRPDTVWSDLQSVVDTTAALGSKIIALNINLPLDNQTVDLFSRYCEYAKQSGIQIAIEFVPYSALRTLELAVRMIEQSGQSNAGLLVDPLHLARSGGSPAAIKKVDPKRIILVQLCDAKKRNGTPTSEELIKEADRKSVV